MKKPIIKIFLAIISLALFFSCSKKQDVTAVKSSNNLSSDNLILSFTLNAFNPVITGTIDQSAKTIALTVPSGTNITTLTPTITVSDKATISPNSGAAQDFTKNVNYTVTAEDGTKQTYKVTVSLQFWFTEAMAAQLIANATYPSTYGIIGQVNSTYHTFWTAVIYPKDTIVTAASAKSVMPSFGYTSEWLDSLTSINQGSPTTAVGLRGAYYFKGTGNYDDGNAFSSSYSDTGAFVIDYFFSDLPFNMTYTRSEKTVSETGAKNTLTDKLTWRSSNIVVGRHTGVIMSGTTSVNLAVTTLGQTLKYQGTITFSGNNQASLVLNSGVSYPLHWQ